MASLKRWRAAFCFSVLDLLAASPRPLEVASVMISFGVALSMFMEPGLFWSSWQYEDVSAIWPYPRGWGMVFAFLGTWHVAAFVLASRWMRRLVLMIKVVWAGFVTALFLSAPPFGPTDVLCIVYWYTSAVAFVQLRFAPDIRLRLRAVRRSR